MPAMVNPDMQYLPVDPPYIATCYMTVPLPEVVHDCALTRTCAGLKRANAGNQHTLTFRMPRVQSPSPLRSCTLRTTLRYALPIVSLAPCLAPWAVPRKAIKEGHALLCPSVWLQCFSMLQACIQITGLHAGKSCGLQRMWKWSCCKLCCQHKQRSSCWTSHRVPLPLHLRMLLPVRTQQPRAHPHLLDNHQQR